jgi:hypothetical protein
MATTPSTLGDSLAKGLIKQNVKRKREAVAIFNSAPFTLPVTRRRAKLYAHNVKYAEKLLALSGALLVQQELNASNNKARKTFLMGSGVSTVDARLGFGWFHITYADPGAASYVPFMYPLSVHGHGVQRMAQALHTTDLGVISAVSAAHMGHLTGTLNHIHPEWESRQTLYSVSRERLCIWRRETLPDGSEDEELDGYFEMITVIPASGLMRDRDIYEKAMAGKPPDGVVVVDEMAYVSQYRQVIQEKVRSTLTYPEVPNVDD